MYCNLVIYNKLQTIIYKAKSPYLPRADGKYELFRDLNEGC